MYVPSGANTASMPAFAFGAPHTTSTSGLPGSISTCSTCSLSAFGCFLASTTRAIVKAPSLAPASSMPSTSSPMALSFAAISSTRLVGVQMILQPGQGEFHFVKSFSGLCDAWRERTAGVIFLAPV